MSTPPPIAAGLEFKYQVKGCRDQQLPLADVAAFDLRNVPIVTAVKMSNPALIQADLEKERRLTIELERRLREYENNNNNVEGVNMHWNHPSQQQQHVGRQSKGSDNQLCLGMCGRVIGLGILVVFAGIAGVCANGICGERTLPQEQPGFSNSSSLSSHRISITPTMSPVTDSGGSSFEASASFAFTTLPQTTPSPGQLSDTTNTSNNLRPIVQPTANSSCNNYTLDTVQIDRSLETFDSKLWNGKTIPSCLGLLTALTRLYLYNSQLTGTIPSQLGELKALKELFLPQNQLTGTIPTQLEQLTALTALGLSNNQLTGTIPNQLRELTALSLLSM